MSKKQTETPILADEMLGKSEAFVLKYKNVITGTILAIILIVGGFMAYNNYVGEPKNAEAYKAIFHAEHLFLDGEYEQALNGDGVNAGFIKVIEDHSGTPAANIAKAYAGLCYIQLGDIDNAIKYLEEYSGEDQVIAPKVKAALANCHAQKENWNKAIDLLLDAADEAKNVAVTPECWRDAAAIYEKIGKNEEARKLYERIKNEYPESHLSMDADKMINSVK